MLQSQLINSTQWQNTYVVKGAGRHEGKYVDRTRTYQTPSL